MLAEQARLARTASEAEEEEEERLAAEKAVQEPTQMMLCKLNGDQKHTRWFWVADATARTLCWGKKPRVAVKGPFVLTAVEEAAGGRLKFVTDGEDALVKPSNDAEHQVWLRGCQAVLSSH